MAAAHSPVLPGSHLPHSYRTTTENMAYNNSTSNRFSGPSSPSYFTYPAPSFPSSSSPSEGSGPSPNEGNQMRLPPLRSMQMLPSITTFSDPTPLSQRQSLSPYEHYPAATSYFATGPRSPYSPHHMGSSTIPSPMSDTQRPINKKGPWTKAEDELLIFHVTQQQQSNVAHATHWGDISKLLGEMRTAKQCRERYTQNLAPGLNRQPITDDEAVFIKEWVSKHGTQWAELSRQPEVRGRSDNHLKNWWNGQRKQHEDHNRSMRKANARRSSQQSLSQRSSASPSRMGQQSLPSLSSGSNSLPSSVSPPESLPSMTHRHRVLPPPQPQQQHSSNPSQGQRMTMANILN